MSRSLEKRGPGQTTHLCFSMEGKALLNSRPLKEKKYFPNVGGQRGGATPCLSLSTKK